VHRAGASRRSCPWSLTLAVYPGPTLACDGVGQISDIVDGISFPPSSPCITGEILRSDGGQTASH
jgi:hypothetical protein